MTVAKLQVQRRCTNRIMLIMLTWRATDVKGWHGHRVLVRGQSVLQDPTLYSQLRIIWSQRLVKDAAQISKHSAGLVGSQAFVCLYLDLQCPASPRPLAAIYPCCMLACLCSVIVFTPHLLLLLPPSDQYHPTLALVGRFIFELPAKHLGWQAMELDRCCDCFVWFLPPSQLHKVFLTFSQNGGDLANPKNPYQKILRFF